MIIRQSAFENKKEFLRGALHCHTTRSDGAGSPEEVIKLHANNGYSFMAITDHRIYNYNNYAPETDMIIIPGMEFDDTFYHDQGFRCFHSVCIGPEKENGNGFENDQRFESGSGKNQEEYQKYLDWLHGNNNMTIYCHPVWSSTPSRYFEKLQGNFAMEIWNSGCAIEHDMDNDAAYWDELLGQGQKIWGVATDDGHAMKHHCKGWVEVNAEKNVDSILESLKNGAFYSSCGPEIYDFYVEDEIAYVECSPCCMIKFISDCHPTKMVYSENGDKTSAKINLGGKYKYIRITIKDLSGRLAWTNPIFLN